tara:strand:- start:1068 stop:3716 length:2649 start_codon:yes stop_codon:yes gene_type:complete
VRINILFKNFKIKLIFLLLVIILLIFAILPKGNFKENLAQNIRIYTCQPNFTNHDDAQLFKIKRLIKGTLNFLKKGCEYEEIKIHINFNNFSKIKKDRLRALQANVLIAPKKVSATIIHKNKKFRAKVRLKGDLSNHWGLNKQWSLRIELRNGKSINGMKEFSITKLKERSFPENLIVGNQFSRMGLISPNFKIYKTNVNGSNWGLMIAEEQFSNVFLENRKLKESLIFKLTNDVDFKMSKFKNIKISEKENFFLKQQGKIEVDVYNKKKINNEYYLRNHESLIKSINLILNSEYDEKEKLIFLKEYFNLEKFGKLLANVVFYNSFHSLYLNNLRFYLNPYNLKIEPIPTDNSPGEPFNFIDDYTNTLKNLNHVLKVFFYDKNFINAYKNSLTQIQFDLDNMKIDLNNLCKKFEEYCEKMINFNKLESHIFNLIKVGDQIFPEFTIGDIVKNPKTSLSLNPYEFEVLKIFNTYVYARLFDGHVKIYNLTSNDINLQNLNLYYSKEGKTDCKIFKKKNCYKEVYKLNYNLSKRTENFFNEKIKLDLDSNRNLVWGMIEGNIESENFNYLIKYENKEFNVDYFVNKKKDYNDFLSDPINKTYIISGKYFIDKPIKVPKNYNLNIKSGSELIFKKDAYIYLNNGNLILDGKDKEIVLKTNDEFWGGIYVNNAPGLSIINNTKIVSVKNFEHEGIYLTGGINFYKSDVEIIDTKIIDNKCEDAINIIESKFKISNSEIKNALSDGVDSDFSNGSIINSLFKDIGGDAIDTSGSNISIINTKIQNVKDKGLSAGENSKINIERLKIESATFGLVSKDLSTIEGKKIEIYNSVKFDVIAFEKKNHFGPGYININDVETNNKILSQVGSKIIINNELIKSKNFDTKDFY